MNKTLPTEVLKQLRIILSAVRQHFHALEACGVSGAQAWILSAIAETPGITVTQLSEALSVHVSTASNTLDKLVKAELVRRGRSETDRRVVNVHLTDKGRAVLECAPKPFSGVLPHALDKLPEKTLIRLHKDLDVLIQQMSHADGDGDAANNPLSSPVR